MKMPCAVASAVVFLAACGGPSGSPGATTGAATTAGTSGGLLSAGQPCGAASACLSGLCGVNGSGHCCLAQCSTSDATCGANDCDGAGACVYPTNTVSCGSASCASGQLTSAGACDGKGNCGAGTHGPCPDNFACKNATSCATDCASSTGCQSTFVCNAAACVSPAPHGGCTENDDCTSGICGIDGGGNCCMAACAAVGDPACGATGCEAATGACIYPSGAACGTNSCSDHTLTAGICDATGTCNQVKSSCPHSLVCNDGGTACETHCTATADCVTGYWCAVDAGSCGVQLFSGPCSENDACFSGICGLAGGGNCCSTSCSTTDKACGATGCDASSAACLYPDAGTACGTVVESCTGTTQQNPSVCDGSGSCNDAPGTKSCIPYICGPRACLSTCTDNTSCGSGDFCDTANGSCCSGLAGGDAIEVDATTGSDATACCGIGKKGACQTIHQAMKLIDSAQAKGVTITATVGGGGGDWNAKGEVFPIVLGWGAELSAAGVYFTDANGNPEVIDIVAYSKNDTVGYASIAGSAISQVSVGMDSQNDQSTDTSAIHVEKGQTLYIADAFVNGNSASTTTAITVAAGATLTLGQDQSASVTGTVNIGSATVPDGWDGIDCQSDGVSKGCTINDATLAAGVSSVAIVDQEDFDLDVEDFGTVSLTSAPSIGQSPVAAGFQTCNSKSDASTSQVQAVLLHGAATMTFGGGVVQCISGAGFELTSSANGTPTLTLKQSTIQNTEVGIYALAGKATVSDTSIQYNYNGVEQWSDKNNNIATIDLSGGGLGGNTVACSNSVESAFGAPASPGVGVLNTTTQQLSANHVKWDNSPPDLFSCNANLQTCTCQNGGTCTNPAGTDNMDAVYTGSGTVSQDTPGLAALNCAASAAFCSATVPCFAWETCCTAPGGKKGSCSEGSTCP